MLGLGTLVNRTLVVTVLNFCYVQDLTQVMSASCWIILFVQRMVFPRLCTRLYELIVCYFTKRSEGHAWIEVTEIRKSVDNVGVLS